MFDGKECRLPCYLLHHFGGTIKGAPYSLGNKRQEIRVSATVFYVESVRWLLTHFMTSISDIDPNAKQVKCLLCGRPTMQACMDCREAGGMPAALCWNAASGNLCFLTFHLMPAEQRQQILSDALASVSVRPALTWAEPDPFYRLPRGAAASCIATCCHQGS